MAREAGFHKEFPAGSRPNGAAGPGPASATRQRRRLSSVVADGENRSVGPDNLTERVFVAEPGDDCRRGYRGELQRDLVSAIGQALVDVVGEGVALHPTS